MQLLAGGIAAAGLIAAAGPIIIHLLNRQRFKVVQWAAMDFLREALRRNKKILRLRDMLLLALRCACLALFGLALARPHFTTGGAAAGAGQPVHAVFLIDNSLSMNYRPFNTTLLDDAKTRARELIERLPQGSRMTVLPLCGSSNAFSRDAYRTVQDALDAVQRIEVVDRTAHASQAGDLAVAACQTVPDLPAKRVIFLGDQQVNNWPQGALESRAKDLPEMQVVQVSAERPENAWVEELVVQDGVADIETPATIIARIRYDGPSPRPNVQVTLTIDNAPVATRAIDLEPGQTRLVQFTQQFDLPVEAGQAAFVPVSLSLSPDKLPEDDQRFISVPVVAALPVVFIDQYGEAGENPALNHYGETFPLRTLLAPVVNRNEADRQLVKIKHITSSEISKEALQDARLVVIAGVDRPGSMVPLLRDYVKQGGQVIICAGGEFDPVAWTKEGWLDGAGILPLPLAERPIGQLPQEAVDVLRPFLIDPQSLVADDFFIAESSKEEFDDLVRTPLFFKAVAADDTPEVLKTLLAADTRRLTEEGSLQTDVAAKRRDWEARRARGLSAEDQAKFNSDELIWGEKIPTWLRWTMTLSEQERNLKPDESARRSQPRVLAKFNNGKPFLVERKLGKGSIVLATSGAQSQWNTLFGTNAVLLFDQLLRSRIARTLPQRTVGTLSEMVIPVEASTRRAEFTLARPGGTKETLTVDALGDDQFGLTLRNLTQRGLYRVTAMQTAERQANAAPEKLWDLPIAVNGLAAESDLKSLDASGLVDRAGHPHVRWIGAGQAITLDGTEIGGMNLWAWLLFLVIITLFAEMALISWPIRPREVALAT